LLPFNDNAKQSEFPLELSILERTNFPWFTEKEGFSFLKATERVHFTNPIQETCDYGTARPIALKVLPH
jgi:hypothetical protein